MRLDRARAHVEQHRTAAPALTSACAMLQTRAQRQEENRVEWFKCATAAAPSPLTAATHRHAHERLRIATPATRSRAARHVLLCCRCRKLNVGHLLKRSFKQRARTPRRLPFLVPFSPPMCFALGLLLLVLEPRLTSALAACGPSRRAIQPDHIPHIRTHAPSRTIQTATCRSPASFPCPWFRDCRYYLSIRNFEEAKKLAVSPEDFAKIEARRHASTSARPHASYRTRRPRERTRAA
eukprot:6185508-Pleurochrysis_carterae.AAC.4